MLTSNALYDKLFIQTLEPTDGCQDVERIELDGQDVNEESLN